MVIHEIKPFGVKDWYDSLDNNNKLELMVQHTDRDTDSRCRQFVEAENLAFPIALYIDAGLQSGCIKLPDNSEHPEIPIRDLVESEAGLRGDTKEALINALESLNLKTHGDLIRFNDLLKRVESEVNASKLINLLLLD